MSETRHCTVCHGPFAFYRGMGRPQELCSRECRKESARRRQRAFMRRRMARTQRAGFQAQAA